MDSRLISILDGFQFNSRMMQLMLSDLSGDEWAYSGANTNSFAWLVAHLCYSRRSLCRRLGLEVPQSDWESLVKRGAKKGDANFVGREQELSEAFFAAANIIASAIPTLPGDKLDETLGREMPNGGNTVLSLLSFLVVHEAYHIGQLGLLRVQMGKSSIA